MIDLPVGELGPLLMGKHKSPPHHLIDKHIARAHLDQQIKMGVHNRKAQHIQGIDHEKTAGSHAPVHLFYVF